MNDTLTSIKGLNVGHSTHLEKLTGCTLITFDKPTLVAYKGFGGAIASYNTTAIQNGSNDCYLHGIFLTGASKFGLGVVGELNKYLAQNGPNSRTYAMNNVVLVGATVVDLGTRLAQFDYIYGKEACQNLSTNPVAQGNVGAGTGTSVGKYSYLTDNNLIASTKSGIGCSNVKIGDNIIVSALSVVNAKGNIIGQNGEILAGNRSDVDGQRFKPLDELKGLSSQGNYNTTLTVIGTNFNVISHENCEKIALFGTQGQSRAIDPLNTSQDGDIVFSFSTQEFDHFLTDPKITSDPKNQLRMELDIIGNAAAKAVQQSIYNACEYAETIKLDWAYNGVIPNYKEIS